MTHPLDNLHATMLRAARERYMSRPSALCYAIAVALYDPGAVDVMLLRALYGRAA